ncbi:hypothetical protein [Streptomyces sp. NPDC002533]
MASLLVSASEEIALLDRPPYASSEPDGMPVPLDMAEPVRRGYGSGSWWTARG